MRSSGQRLLILLLTPINHKQGLGGQHHNVFAAAFGDGNVKLILDDIAAKTLPWLVNSLGGDQILRF